MVDFSQQIEDELSFIPRHPEPTHKCEYREQFSQALNGLAKAYGIIAKKDIIIKNQRELIKQFRDRISDNQNAEGNSSLKARVLNETIPSPGYKT